jgi:hypothetical protein
MTDDAPRAPTEEERARMHAAARAGGICAGCGRALVADEPVWRVRRVVRPVGAGGSVSWIVPLAAECVPPEMEPENAGWEPAPCGGCGRPVYQRGSGDSGPRPFCCTRCRYVAQTARISEQRRRARE